MKNIYFLVQLNPEVIFNTPSFDSYVFGLVEYFLLANLLFIALMLLVFLFYYACCILSIGGNKRKASQINYKASDAQVEVSVNI